MTRGEGPTGVGGLIRLAAVTLAAGVLTAAVGGPSPAAGASTAIPVLQINGKGFGHGVGMAQDGELAMGQAGAGTDRILGQFYPGTTLTRAGGQVRVVVLGSTPPRTEVVLPSGGQVDDAQSGPQSPGFPLRVPAGDAVTVTLSGGTYTATVSGPVSAQAAAPAVTIPFPPQSTTTTSPSSATTTTTSPLARLEPTTTSTSTTTTTPALGPAPSTTSTTTSTGSSSTPPAGSQRAGSSRPIWLVPASAGVTYVVSTGRRYRGVVEAVGNNGGGELDLVNQLDVETYLRGMGEVQDPSWPQASLEAQAIIERTYALRAMQAAGEICDDTRCQVYLGAQAEYQAQDQAVSATAGEVLAYGGALAATVFSANAGGYSATPQEGFGPGAGDYPYLRAAPYPTTNPDPWSLTVGLSAVASRLDYPGALSSVAVATTGPSGRALTVSLLGSAGPATVDGVQFAADLGLRSTLFQLFDTVSAKAPPPPPPAQTTQALPDDASALAAAAANPVAVPRPAGGARTPVAEPGAHHSGPASGPGTALAWLSAALLVMVAGATAAARRLRPGSRPASDGAD